MAMFTDTVTLYHKLGSGDYEVTVIDGVQWSDRTEKKNEGGKLSIVKYAQITFPEGTYEKVSLDAACSEDCIVYGKVNECVSDAKGCRISDLMKRHPKSGLIKAVNDNSRRDFLKNVKVVVE